MMSKFFRGDFVKLLLPVLFYLCILIFIDNVLLQGLQSPLAILDWSAQIFNDPSLKSEYVKTGSVIANFPGWADSFIWVIITLILWIIGKKKLLYLPLILYTAWITFWIIVGVFILAVYLWNPQSGAEILLSDAFFLWTSIIIVFAIWYWLLDHDNQKIHAHSKNHKLHFMFPQKTDPMPGWDDWIPGFIDYLFFSFNTSTAFGSSDTLILTKKAKILIIVQSFLSLILFVMIIGRAINIIK